MTRLVQYQKMKRYHLRDAFFGFPHHVAFWLRAEGKKIVLKGLCISRLGSQFSSSHN